LKQQVITHITTDMFAAAGILVR